MHKKSIIFRSALAIALAAGLTAQTLPSNAMTAYATEVTPEASSSEVSSESTTEDSLVEEPSTEEVTDDSIQNVQASTVAINSTNFPDTNFRNFITDNFDTNHNGELSIDEIEAVTYMSCQSKNISSLKGIEFFTKLTTLQCYSNNLTTLDLSKNTELLALYCADNQLANIKIDSCTKLRALSCFNNNLTTLDISKNTNLKNLICYNNQLTSLDLSDCPLLYEVQCQQNNIKTLDFSKNPDLNVYGFDADEVQTTDLHPYRSGGQWGYLLLHYNTSDGYIDLSKLPGIDTEQMILSNTSSIYNPDTHQLFLQFSYNSSIKQYHVTYGDGYHPLSKQFRAISVTCDSYTDTATSFVGRIYTKALGRSADPSGLEYWANEIKSGSRTPIAVAEEFFFSEEFTNKNLNNTEYVKVLYRTFMNREYDNAGLNYWVEQLNQGASRKAVLESFAGCEEFQIIADQALLNPYTMSYVSRMYTEALGRSFEIQGLQYWALEIANGNRTPVSVAKEFIFSEEFTSKNLSNREYVEVLYKTFMGRDSDESGMNYWLSQLNAGVSRNDVLESFASCPEFQKIVSDFGL